MVLGCRAVHGFAGSDAVGVVGIGNRIITMREGGQPPAVLPGEGETVPVGEGVADQQLVLFYSEIAPVKIILLILRLPYYFVNVDSDNDDR